MKKVLAVIWTCLLMIAGTIVPAFAADSKEMYRLYNPNSGEHFYTAEINERDHLIEVGWFYEGVGWYAPIEGSPVYRLYNPNAGDHHYTMDANERDSLVKVGWRYEGVCWSSSTGDSMPVYRQYNPNARAGSHNYTTSLAENNFLVNAGWRAEGIGWYAILEGWNLPGQVWIPRTGNRYHLTQTCSQMRNPSLVSRSQAEAQGYKPCKTCVLHE